MSDLRFGERISISYEDADGVLVANRIGREPAGHAESEGETASSAVNRVPVMNGQARGEFAPHFHFPSGGTVPAEAVTDGDKS